jgi:hypothetical protein
MKKLLLFLFIFLFVVFQLNAIAAARTASQTGNWNVTSTWGELSVPGSGDDVTIDGNFTVTVTIPAACATLTINQKTKNEAPTLTISSGQTLTGYRGNFSYKSNNSNTRRFWSNPRC